MAQEYIYGINPVKEALAAGREFEKLYVTKSSQAVSRLAARVRQSGAPVIQVDERRLDQIIGEKVVHQGICALLSEIPFVEVEEILAMAGNGGSAPSGGAGRRSGPPQPRGHRPERRGPGGPWLILPKRRSAPVSATAMKASAGALNHLPVARVGNLASCLDALKRKGLWIAGADMGCPDAGKTNLAGPLALCLGGEGGGPFSSAPG